MLIDEANIWFSSRFWHRIPPQMLYLWSQTRKFSIDMIYTTQSFRRVDTALREITNYVYKVRLRSFLPRIWRDLSGFFVYVVTYGKKNAKKLKYQVKMGQLFFYLASVEKYLPYDIDTRDGISTNFNYLRKDWYIIGKSTWDSYSTTEKIYIPSIYLPPEQPEQGDAEEVPISIYPKKYIYSQKIVKVSKKDAD